MKVLLVNTSEQGGGAAIATSRLKEALIDNGIRAKLLVRVKKTNNLSVVGLKKSWKLRYNFTKERFKIWKTNGFHREHLFDIDIASNGTDITKLQEFKDADIIHLNWINQGFISMKGLKKILKSGKPIVWTMHDMWEFTGVCHYVYDCEKYKTECHNCPLMKNPRRKDLSYKTFRKKAKLFQDYTINFVAVSSWLAQKAKQSQLLKYQPVSIIPNALSISQFSLKDKQAARNLLSLPDKYIILFGAIKIDDERKGFEYLVESIKILLEKNIFQHDQLLLTLFGEVKNEEILSNLPIEYTNFGFIKDDDELSALYAAANVTVIPSLYETFGQTVVEALACGCLPVTFNNSGQTDIIEHKTNGFLAEYLSTESLADGIQWALETSISPADLRATVTKKYSESVIANKYIELYNKLAKTKA